MEDNDLIGRVVRLTEAKLNGIDREVIRFQIVGMDPSGLCRGVCINDDVRIRGLINLMRPDFVRRETLGRVISFDEELKRRGRWTEQMKIRRVAVFGIEPEAEILIPERKSLGQRMVQIFSPAGFMPSDGNLA